jgi:hypothetical protein
VVYEAGDPNDGGLVELLAELDVELLPRETQAVPSGKELLEPLLTRSPLESMPSKRTRWACALLAPSANRMPAHHANRQLRENITGVNLKSKF